MVVPFLPERQAARANYRFGGRGPAVRRPGGSRSARRRIIGMERIEGSRSPLWMRALAVAVLAVAAWVLFKLVIGVLTAVAWVAVAVVGVIGVLWALSVLRR